MRIGKGLLFLLAFGVAGYAAYAYGFLPLGSRVHPDMKAVFQAHSLGIYSHVFASIVALVVGPFQFVARLRRNPMTLHRWMGRVYLGVGVLVGGVAGLYMAQYAFGGLGARLGFAGLAVVWLYTGFRAYRAIRRRAVETHRRWMIRNYALTLAAVTLRLYLPASMVFGIPFEMAYPVIVWLCWVPNLIVAEWLCTTPPAIPFIARRQTPRAPSSGLRRAQSATRGHRARPGR